MREERDTRDKDFWLQLDMYGGLGKNEIDFWLLLDMYGGLGKNEIDFCNCYNVPTLFAKIYFKFSVHDTLLE